MSARTCRYSYGKAAPKIVPPRSRIPYWKGLCADSEEKREPASDIDTAIVDGLKVLDPDRPIREADMRLPITECQFPFDLSFEIRQWIARRRSLERSVFSSVGRDRRPHE